MATPWDAFSDPMTQTQTVPENTLTAQAPSFIDTPSSGMSDWQSAIQNLTPLAFAAAGVSAGEDVSKFLPSIMRGQANQQAQRYRAAQIEDMQKIHSALEDSINETKGDYARAIPLFKAKLPANTLQTPEGNKAALLAIGQMRDKSIAAQGEQRDQQLLGTLFTGLQNGSLNLPSPLLARAWVAMNGGSPKAQDAVVKAYESGFKVFDDKGLATVANANAPGGLSTVTGGTRVTEAKENMPAQTITAGPSGVTSGVVPGSVFPLAKGQEVRVAGPTGTQQQLYASRAPEIKLTPEEATGLGALKVDVNDLEAALSSQDPMEKQNALEIRKKAGEVGDIMKNSPRLTPEQALILAGQNMALYPKSGRIGEMKIPTNPQTGLQVTDAGPAPGEKRNAPLDMTTFGGTPVGVQEGQTQQRERVAISQGRGAALGAQEAEETKRVGTNSKDYIYTDTGQTIRSSHKLSELDRLEAEGKVVHIPDENSRKTVQTIRPMYAKLQRLKEIVERNNNLFIDDSKSLPADTLKVWRAQARAALTKSSDPDAAFIVNSMAPSGAALNRYSGDSGNVNLSERAANLAALGANPSTKSVARRLIAEMEQSMMDDLKAKGINPYKYLGIKEPLDEWLKK